MRRTAKDGANAVSFRRSLFLTTAVVTLVTIFDRVQTASAQSVTGSGVNPGGIVSPNWSVSGDLQIGTPGGGPLNITGGGTVTNDTGLIGNGASDQGTVTVSGRDASGNASTWTNNGDLVVSDEASDGDVFVRLCRISQPAR